mgnify:CR=1 FL=1
MSTFKRDFPHRLSNKISLLFLFAVATLFLSSCSIDKLMGFQGYLTDSQGNPITGTRNIVVKFWNCALGSGSGCAVQFQETHNNVVVDSGLFNLVIGSQEAIDPSKFSQNLWMEIIVNGETLSPRQRVLGAPYAFSLVGGSVVASSHEGDGDTGGGDDDITDENYGSLSVVAFGAKGTSLMLGVLANGGDLIRACSGGVAARGCPDLEFRVTSNGNVTADGAFHGGGADFAEMISKEAPDRIYEPGDVLVISPRVDRAVTLSTKPYSKNVIGVYSTKPGFIGRPYDIEDAVKFSSDLPVAIVGIVPVKVTAENGPIYRGDLLTTSSTPGYAMKATEPLPGTILGKAMGQLLSGKGIIEVLLVLQ